VNKEINEQSSHGVKASVLPYGAFALALITRVIVSMPGVRFYQVRQPRPNLRFYLQFN
jgi:hypothetical protein